MQTEFIQVEQGHALVTIGTKTAVFGPHDGVVTIPRFTIHAYQRADETPEGAASRDVVLHIKEWTDPADGSKEVFFRNIISCIRDRREGLWGGLSLLLSLFVVMHKHDNYPLIWSGPRFLGPWVQQGAQRLVTHGVLNLMALLGFLLGFKGEYSEYTP